MFLISEVLGTSKLGLFRRLVRLEPQNPILIIASSSRPIANRSADAKLKPRPTGQRTQRVIKEAQQLQGQLLLSVEAGREGGIDRQTLLIWLRQWISAIPSTKPCSHESR